MAVLGAPIVVDGSYGEGGGALLRTALSMATLTQQPLRLTNIRGGTRSPGLNPEDLTVTRALALSCNAEVLGASPGEQSLSFLTTQRPKGLNEKLGVEEGYEGPGFANSLVVLNTLLPIMARTGVYTKLSATGETYGNGILSYDYFANVTVQAHRRMGIYAFPELSLAGFGRSSRGEVRLEIEPSASSGVQWGARGELYGCRAVVVTSELSGQVGDRGIAHLARLAHHAGLELESDSIHVRARGAGAFATVWGEFSGGMGGATAMGARGLRIEAVVQSAFERFFEWFKGDATVDQHLADQILIAAVMAEGESEMKVDLLTRRFLSQVWVVKQFLPIHITVRGSEGEPGVVTIRR